MILDLGRVSAEEETFSADEVVGVHDAFGDENPIKCHIDVSVRRIGETFYIHAQLAGVFSTSCHKCLEPTDYRVGPSFDLVVKRVHTEQPVDEDGGDDMIFLPAGENQFSLDHQIYEHLVVEIPIQVFCRDNCKGLCPTCGANLNRDHCQCAVPVESRWNALRKIKDAFPKQ